MGNTARIELKGFDVLRDIFKDVPDDIARKAGVDALRLGAKPILEEAQNLVPEGATGKLADSLEIATKKASFPIVKIQANRKKGGSHAHLVELGTAPRTTESKPVHSTGTMPKKPFMRPAFESKKGESLKIVLTEIAGKLANRLKKELKK